MKPHHTPGHLLARVKRAVLVSTLALTAFTPFAVHAVGPNLVVNGGFETGTSINPTGSSTPALSYSIDSSNGGGTVTGWTTTGYNFVYASPSDAMNTGAWTPQYNSYTKLWNTTTPTNTGTLATDPNGGRFLGADGAFQVGAISQVIQTSLTVGATYDLSFYWAGAQQTGFTGINTEGWSAALSPTSGAPNYTQATQIVTNVSQGFTGWMYSTMTFTAQSASSTLSFLANGTPSGQPPFVLLDGVSLTARNNVPEPATLLLLVPAFAAVAGLRRRRARTA